MYDKTSAYVKKKRRYYAHAHYCAFKHQIYLVLIEIVGKADIFTHLNFVQKYTMFINEKQNLKHESWASFNCMAMAARHMQKRKRNCCKF